MCEGRTEADKVGQNHVAKGLRCHAKNLETSFCRQRHISSRGAFTGKLTLVALVGLDQSKKGNAEMEDRKAS